MSDKKPYVTIKGNQEGLTLVINDDVSFSEALKELEVKLQSTETGHHNPVVPVRVQTGNRYLNQEQQTIIREMIEKSSQFKVEAIEADVIPYQTVTQLQQQSEVKVKHQIIRSGQVLRITGDLLLIGDVNPGGKVMATGNVYIMGNLHGVAHAGYAGNRNTFIAASYMNPTQLRIADYISRAPDYESDGVYMECAVIDETENKIIIDSFSFFHISERK